MTLNIKYYLKKTLGYNLTIYDKFRPTIPISLLNKCLAISEEHEYIFCRIPKAANSTMVSTLINIESGELVSDSQRLIHLKNNYYKHPENTEKSIKELENYKKFMISRNPYTRVWSAYLEKITVKERVQRNIVLKKMNLPESSNISFDMFLDFLENGGINLNGHWARQSQMLVFPVSDYDVLGKIESIETDLNKITNLVYGSSNHTLVNFTPHGTNASVKVKHLMKPSHVDRIYRLYEADFDAFHYSKQFDL